MSGAQWPEFLCRHIPDRYEHLVRCVGWYSNRVRGERIDLPIPACSTDALRTAWNLEAERAQRGHELCRLPGVGHRVGCQPAAYREAGLEAADLLGFPGGVRIRGARERCRQIDARFEVGGVARDR